MSDNELENIFGVPSAKAQANQSNSDEMDQEIEDVEAIPIPSIPDLLQMSVKEKWVVVEDDGKKWKVKIRPLTFGELQDAGTAGMRDIKVYRKLLVWKGVVQPAIESLDYLERMPYTLIVNIAVEVEKLSKATGKIQKKF